MFSATLKYKRFAHMITYEVESARIAIFSNFTFLDSTVLNTEPKDHSNDYRL